jgi:hypothetical protein
MAKKVTRKLFRPTSVTFDTSSQFGCILYESTSCVVACTSRVLFEAVASTELEDADVGSVETLESMLEMIADGDGVLVLNCVSLTHWPYTQAVKAKYRQGSRRKKNGRI